MRRKGWVRTMSNKNEVFEYLIDQLRQQVNSNPYKQQCEDLAHEVQSLKNQLRDASAQIKELHIALVKATGDAEAYKLIRKGGYATEQSGCRKEDTQVAEPWVKWEGGECPVPKDTIVQIRMRDGTSACEPGVAGELRWDHRGWRGDITRYRVVKPECEHEWRFYNKGASMMCKKCGLNK
nr:MAG TPA_asm: protein of unknown function (DUF5320) [Caudoviricetes sp.]